ncbi:hypothetical protein [Bradyrhizobium sp. Ce-3]|uniref:hypothetical protein n=1 Tax=Bradyrhizobium sp. Ce-3 TaxID=2913970 RepID=UPI001FBABC85|nr:hypothetical protein [Bradyrhizobium sp. Ce-3]
MRIVVTLEVFSREVLAREVLAFGVLALGLLVMLCVSASAAPRRQSHARQAAPVHSPAAAAPAGRFAVPGWSDQSTRQWLDRASSYVGLGG